MKQTLIIAAMCLLVSCGPSKEEYERQEMTRLRNSTVINKLMVVVTIDRCEYITYNTGDSRGGVAIIHKQNCKNH